MTRVPQAPGEARASETDHDRIDWKRTLSIGWLVAVASGGAVIVLYGFAAAGPHLRHISVGLLTAGAAMIAGVFVGFLFGIPKFVSSGKARARGELAGRPAGGAGADATGSAWSPSTNLAEISDWLTKLLLGAGLVQLTSLGAPARDLVYGVAEGLTGNGEPAGAAVVVAGSVLVLFFVLGFIMGYMLTTLWYRHVLADDRPDRPVPTGPAAPQRRAHASAGDGSGRLEQPDDVALGVTEHGERRRVVDGRR